MSVNNRDGKIIKTFPNGEEYVFRLAWGQLIKLEESREMGSHMVWLRLHDGTWSVKDISEVVFQGLVGGGMGEVKAKKLVREYIEARPPVDSIDLAKDIMNAGLLGAPEEEIDATKKAEASSGSMVSQTDASVSARSTGSVQ